MDSNLSVISIKECRFINYKLLTVTPKSKYTNDQYVCCLSDRMDDLDKRVHTVDNNNVEYIFLKGQSNFDLKKKYPEIILPISPVHFTNLPR